MSQGGQKQRVTKIKKKAHRFEAGYLVQNYLANANTFLMVHCQLALSSRQPLNLIWSQGASERAFKYRKSKRKKFKSATILETGGGDIRNTINAELPLKREKIECSLAALSRGFEEDVGREPERSHVHPHTTLQKFFCGRLRI